MLPNFLEPSFVIYKEKEQFWCFLKPAKLLKEMTANFTEVVVQRNNFTMEISHVHMEERFSVSFVFEVL